jgi:hypothetical protein
MKESTKEPRENPSKSEQTLSRIVALVSGLGLGATLSLSEAARTTEGEFSLQPSAKTAIAFVLGFVVAYGYLRRILAQPERTSRAFVRSGLIVIILLLLAAFIYPMRFSMGEWTIKLEGAGAAFCFIAGGLVLIRSVVRAAEREEAEQEAKERTESNKPR